MMDFLTMNLTCIAIAVALDIFIGDPDFRWHPVRLIGWLIDRLEPAFYSSPDRVMSGGYFLVVVVFFVTFIAYGLLSIAGMLGQLVYMAVNSLLIYFSISIKSMTDHAEGVYAPLAGDDVEKAREELSMIVSRDTAGMESEMIVRSTVESVSENFTDGVLSPMFFSLFFGGAGAAFFKSVSTLDSMVGYRNEKYEQFGKFSARADDVLGFIPARISVLVIAFAASLRSYSFSRVIDTAFRYRLAHPSPNSAHSMSAFAGALGVRLGGAVSYFGQLKDKPVIGDGENDLKPEVIREAVDLYKTSALVAVCVCAVLAVVF